MYDDVFTYLIIVNILVSLTFIITVYFQHPVVHFIKQAYEQLMKQSGKVKPSLSYVSKKLFFNALTTKREVNNHEE